MACDFYTANVVLGLHCDGTNGSTTFTDVTGKTVTANGNAQISTAQSKFGESSLLLDGTGDYLSVPNSADFSFGTGDFTVEFWLYTPIAWSSQTNISTIVGQKANDSSNGWVIYRDGGQPTKINLRVGLQNNFFTASSPIENVWEHWAAVRQGTQLRWYKNGVLDSTGMTSVTVSEASSPLLVGLGSTWAGSYLIGYIDDLRITKGVARYLGNFTPPTEAFTSTQCAISGVVGSPGNYLERVVRVYRRDTGALVGQVSSNPTTGVYSINTSHNGEHFALVHDSSSISSGAPVGGSFNAVAYDRITPL